MKRPPKPAAWIRLRPAFTPRDGLISLTCPPDPAQRTIKIVSGVGAIIFALVMVYVQGGIGTVPAFFFLVGIATIAMAILRPDKPHTLRITGKTVIVDGPAAWRAPVKNYVGVALRQRRQDGTTLHVVELEHDDPELAIPLHVSTEPPPRELVEGFAQRFDLPALTPSS
jgi:hypothetical protein